MATNPAQDRSAASGNPSTPDPFAAAPESVSVFKFTLTERKAKMLAEILRARIAYERDERRELAIELCVLLESATEKVAS